VSGVLPRDFFDAPATEVAPRLLGQVLEHHTQQGVVRVRLTEVEAYQGAADSASHSFRGRTPRNAVMFGPPGFVYVYFTYGMHFCVNLVCGPGDVASAVLLRAGEVVDGIELATKRRGGAASRDLARGPARLTVAMDIDRDENGLDACSGSSPLRITAGIPTRPEDVRAGPRVGVATSADVAWRFWLDGDRTVSTYRRHVPRRRPA
jgi:DNA-3-methyladenine glycosylase